MKHQLQCTNFAVEGAFSLIGHCLDDDVLAVFGKCWRALYPAFALKVSAPDSPNNPQWIVQVGGERTILQIEHLGRAGRLLADVFVASMSETYGPKFALREIKPGVRIRALAPDPSQPGKFMAVQVGDMEIQESGLLVPSTYRKL